VTLNVILLRSGFKDARSVSFRSILLTSYNLTIFKQQTASRKYEKLPSIVIHAGKNNTEENVFVENVWPANFALFIYVPTHCVEKVK